MAIGPSPELTSAKIPPQDLEAEQAALGSMLLEPGAAAQALSVVRPDDFYREAHKLICRGVQSLESRQEPVDLVTVSAELKRMDKLEEIGGPEYLTALIAEVPTAAHVVRYAKIVAEKAILRRLIVAGDDIAGLAYDEADDVEEVLDRAEQLVFDVAQRRITRDFTHIGPVVEQTFEALDRTFRHKSFLSGVPTGLSSLDAMTSGLQKGNLIVVAGRPSMGKTSLAIGGFALSAAVQHKTGVGIFSLEMSSQQVAELLLCSMARVNAFRLRRGDASPVDWAQIADCLSVLPEAPIYIDDTPAINLLEMRAKARRLKAQHDIGLIIVDYLQLATTGDSRWSDQRHQQISEIARTLKSMARELNVPVVAVSQLSRQVERREDKRPILSDLAESGSIETEADLVMFIYRPKYYERRRAAEEARAQGPAAAEAAPPAILHGPEEAEVIIQKHRTGPVGTIKCIFHEEHRAFYDLEERRAAPPEEQPAPERL